MNAIEDRLRADLERAADGADDDLLDLDALLEAGHGRRSAQNRRRAIGAVAVAAVVGVVAWLGVAPQLNRATPEPLQTTSPTTTPRPPANDTVTLDNPGGGIPREYSSVQVTYRDNQLKVSGVVMSDALGKQGPKPLTTLPMPTGPYAWHRLGKVTTLWVLPGRPQWVFAHDGSTVDQAQRVNAYLAAADITLVLVNVDVSMPATLTKGEGLLWRTEDGAVHSSSGDDSVSVAQVAFGSDSQFILLDSRFDVLTFFSSNEGPGGASTSLSSTTDKQLIKIALSIEDERTDSTVVGLLPKGAHDPEITPASSAVKVGVGALTPDGRVVFMARLTFDPKDKVLPLIRKVTYTDASGTRVTYRPEQ